MLTGPNGLITQANEAKQKTEKAGIEEEVEIEVLGSYNSNGTINKEKLKKNIVEHLGVNEDNIQEDEEGNLRFPLKGFNVTIDNNGNVEVIKNGEEEPVPPDLQESDIGISYDPTGWTQGPVKVTLTKNIEINYKLQYSTSRDSKWRDYTQPFDVADNNTQIYARLVNNMNQGGGQYTTGNVEKIDRLGPSRVEVTNDEPVYDKQTALYNVVVRASADDTKATDKDGCSGIVKYYYTINGPDKNETTEGTSETSHEFKGLKQGETYQVTVTAEDEAKNSNTSEATEITTELSYEPIEGHELEIETVADKQYADYQTGDQIKLGVIFKNIGTKKLTNLTATIHSKGNELYKTKVDILVSELEVNESSSIGFYYTFILDDMGGSTNLIFSMCYTEDGTDWPVKKVENSWTFDTYERFWINTFYTSFARIRR